MPLSLTFRYWEQITEVPNTTDVNELYVWIIGALIVIVTYLAYDNRQKEKEIKGVWQKIDDLHKTYADDYQELAQDTNQIAGKAIQLFEQLRRMLEKHERDNH